MADDPKLMPPDDMIPLRSAGTAQLVPSSTVRWIETHGDQVQLHTTGGTYQGMILADRGEELWNSAWLMRIHESFVVPPRLITELKIRRSDYSVVVGDYEKELPVGRRYIQHVKDRWAGEWESA